MKENLVTGQGTFHVLRNLKLKLFCQVAEKIR